MWCQKEMVLSLSKLFYAAQGLTVDGCQHNPSPPGCLDLVEENTHLIISSFFFLSLSEEAFGAQHEGLKEEKESLTKLQKECTAKRVCVNL